MTLPFGTAQRPVASISTHNEHDSEDEYLDADSTSTDLPPSPKKVGRTGSCQ